MNHAASNPSITSCRPFLSFPALFLFSIALLFECSVPGPTFPAPPVSAQGPGAGHLRFTPPVTFFPRSLLGQVDIEPVRGMAGSSFTMSMVGRLNNGSYRIRRYEGRAILTGGDGMEFRTLRCYLLGKKELEDRLVPLERWDCDHLVFTFRRTGADSEAWNSSGEPAPHGAYTEWFGDFDLIPIVPEPWRKKVVFAGQMLESLPDGSIVVWGSEGGVILRDGQTLQVATPRGNPRGTLEVLSRPGDFLITRLKSGAPPEKGDAIFATEYGKRGGLW